MDTLQTLCIIALGIVLIGLSREMYRLTNVVKMIDSIVTVHNSEDSDEGS
jgi:hypothetical protein